MSSGLALAFVILAALAASLVFLIQAEGGIDEIPRLIDRAGIMIDFQGWK